MNSPGAEHDDELVTRPMTQRTVSAADASPLHTTGASSVFSSALNSWRGGRPDDSTTSETTEQTAGDSDTTRPEAADGLPQDTGEPMAKKNVAARGRKSTRGSPQLQICSLLLQNDFTRDALAEALPDLSAQQIYSALHTAKSAARVEWNEAAGVYALTEPGRAWVEASGAAAIAPQPGAEKPARSTAGRKSAVHRRGKSARAAAQETRALDTSPSPPASRTFRCAVISDGGFWLSKKGVEIELDPEEHAEMLAYLERMAEDAAA